MVRFRIQMVLWFLVLLGAGPRRAHAACTGSGTAWSCAAGTTSAEVAAAVSSAAAGAVLTFAPGSYSWSSAINFSMAKGVTLICATEGACTVTGARLGMTGTCSGTSSALYRISGFVFSGGSQLIWFYGGTCTLSKIRIDHNRFTNQSADGRILMFGENSVDDFFYGLIDHNTVTNASNVMFAEFYAGSGSTAPAGTRGTEMNMVFEDNTMTINTMTNPGLGCIDSLGSPSVVWRYNTTTNCLVTAHGSTGGGGIVNFEVYGNRFIVNSGAAGQGFDGCSRCFHHQGSGETLVFNNEFTASGTKGGPISMTHYRSAPPSVAGYSGARCDGSAPGDGNRAGQLGYPCRRQPGRDVNLALQPMYVWNNRWTDTGPFITMVVENPWGAANPSVADHVRANRDYYNAVSASAQTSSTAPFDGSTGMGFGTLANRPSSCATNSSETGGGVGYFATDQGPHGTLYRCAATNTWVIHYRPYTYPHPLQVSGNVPAPATPTNLRLTQ